MDGLEQDFFERFFDIGDAAPVQGFAALGIGKQRLVLYLAEVHEDMVLVSIQLQIQALLPQLLVGADILQPAAVIAEDGVGVGVPG